jgi:hypothetical protein
VRKFLVPVVLAVALVLPTEAAAKTTTTHYTGAVSPSGTIGFNFVKTVKKKKGHKKKKRLSVNSFQFSGVPVTCSDGAHTAHGIVTFAVPLVGGSFTIQASSTVTGAKLVVQGNLAAGTIQVSGNTAIEPSGTASNCDSGVLNWTAQRG